MISYRDLLMLKLSETTQWNGKEMIIPSSMMIDQFGSVFTCEFVDLTNRIYILRGYYKNGVKYWQKEYQNGSRHGKSFGWYESGEKRWLDEYQNGQLHGQSIYWYEGEDRSWCVEYKCGIIIRSSGGG